MKKNNTQKNIAGFLYEVGTMRKLPRMHRQTLLTDDMSDNIATHSYRVAMIGWFLAKQENVDASKVVMMCLLHDMGEVRTGDHNWIHKRYVKIYDDQIVKEQLGALPFKELEDFAIEYEKRDSKESMIAKDADIIDQILLLREYEWQGNKEAANWLYRGETKNGKATHISRLSFESSKKLAEEIYKQEPSAWWQNLWTSKNR